MLKIVIPISSEEWNEETQEFIEPKYKTIQIEHSLISISKWESKWCKPYLVKEERTIEETIDYIKCMTLTTNVENEVYDHLTSRNMEEIDKYINSPMTATTFANFGEDKPNREIITSELIYYWMIAMNIPVEFEKWHINRLLTLIRICNIKNSPDKKMSRGAVMSRNRALNEARRKQYNTKG